MLGEFCWIIGCPLMTILRSVRGCILFLLFLNYDAPLYTFTSLILRQLDTNFKIHCDFKPTQSSTSFLGNQTLLFLHDKSEWHFNCQNSCTAQDTCTKWAFLEHKFTIQTQLSGTPPRALVGGGCTCNGLLKVTYRLDCLRSKLLLTDNTLDWSYACANTYELNKLPTFTHFRTSSSVTQCGIVCHTVARLLKGQNATDTTALAWHVSSVSKIVAQFNKRMTAVNDTANHHSRQFLNHMTAVA
jgi:hypothetical protein